MTPQDLFEKLTAYPQPTHTEILNSIEELTRNYEPERVNALIADFGDLLSSWKYEEVVKSLRREYDVNYSRYEEALNQAEYAVAMGTNDLIEWPEEPAPFVAPIPFPGFYDDSNVFVPSMYDYAVKLLKSKITTKQPNLYNKKLPPELSTPEASAIFSAVEDAGYCSADGDGYRWENTKALLAYFIDEVSRLLDLRPSNDRIPWSMFVTVFNLSESAKRTCSNEVNRYTTTDKKGAQKNKPEGWRELKNIIDEALNGIPT